MWQTLLVANGIEASAREPSGWVEVGPPTGSELVDLAIQPGDDRSWAVASASGEIWLTSDGGQRWREILGPVDPLGAGDLGAAVEDRLGEIARELSTAEGAGPSEGGEEELLEAMEAEADRAALALRRALDEVRGDLAEAPGLREPVRPRVWFGRGGQLVAARADGLWIAGGSGPSWTRLLEDPGDPRACTADGRWRSEGDCPPPDPGDGGSTSAPAPPGGTGLRLSGGELLRWLPEPPSEISPRIAEGPPLGARIASAAGRGAPVTGADRRRAGLLPALIVESRAILDRGGSWTVGGASVAWELRGALSWRVGAPEAPLDEIDPADALQRIAVDDPLAVLDGPAIRTLGSQIDRTAARYRAERAEAVIRLYRQRQRLALEEAPGDGPLLRRVQRALDLAEVDARLDALDGGVPDRGGER